MIILISSQQKFTVICSSISSLAGDILLCQTLFCFDNINDDGARSGPSSHSANGFGYRGNSLTNRANSLHHVCLFLHFTSSKHAAESDTLLRSLSLDKSRSIRRRKSTLARRYSSHSSSLSRHDRIDTLDDEEINWIRRQTIKDLTTSLDNKRKYRSELMSTPTTTLSSYNKLKLRKNIQWRNFKISVRNLWSYFKIWRDSFKVIEGHFGTGIMQYFRFLKWLFFLNLFIAIFMVSVLVLPQKFLEPTAFQDSIRIKNESNSTSNVNLEVPLDMSTCTIGGFDIHETQMEAQRGLNVITMMNMTTNGTELETTTEIPTTIMMSTSNTPPTRTQYQGQHFFEKKALVCSCNYNKHVENTTKSGAFYIVDFLQGTGWMEKTLLFYGVYYNQTYLDDSVAFLTSTTGLQIDNTYNMGLAYLLTVGLCFIVSLIMMVKQSANGVKETLVISEDKYFRYCNMVFTGWDFALTHERTSELKQKHIFRDIKTELEEARIALHKAAQTTWAKCKLYTTRFFVNLVVVAFLGVSFVAIFFATEYSGLWAKEKTVTESTILELLVQFFPSISITVLNFIIPEIFVMIVAFEEYNPGFEIKVTLARTVFLRLASLAVLISTVWSQVTVCEKTCGNCLKEGIYCWETYVGQQLYKLVILNFLVIVAVTLLAEFPRKFLVKKFSGKGLIDFIGYQEFDIPKNVLDLVYTQTLCWLGLFFSPLIPAITVLECFMIFYLKKWSLLYNCVPSQRAYKTSKSNFFFIVVLMMSFLLPIAFIGYSIVRFPPSQSCGPFRIYSKAEYSMFTTITDQVATWPTIIKDIVEFLGTPGFYIPAAIILILAILYHYAVAAAQKKLLVLLKEQLSLEGKDKQFLLTRVNEALIKQRST